MKMRSFNRIVAVMLCVACLIPNFTGLAEAIGLASAAPRSVQTNSKWVPVSDPFAAGEIPAYQTVGAVTPNALVTDCGNGVQAQAGEVESYYREESGNTVDSRLFVSHDRRNDVLWEFNLTNPTTNEALVYTEGKPLFGGSENEFFYRSIWYKGTQSDAHPFGALTESAADGSYRFLQPNRATLSMT